MTSTASQRLRLDKQATGDNPDAWGERLNGVIDLVDEAFGFAEIAVNGNVTLSTQNFVSDQSRRMVLRFTGSGGFAVTIPAVEKMYYIDNRCAADVVLKTSATPGSAVVAGTKRIAYCDGATVTTDTSSSAPPASAVSVAPTGGIQATNVQAALAELDAEKARLDGATFSGLVRTAQTSGGMSTVTGGLSKLAVEGLQGTGNAAFMSFNRINAFAGYFGIDADNVWKVGGWSSGNVAYTLWHSGNFNPASYAAQGANVTFSRLVLSEQGTGTSLQIGNDAAMGDIDVANTIGVRGLQDANQAFFRMGASTRFGYDGGNWIVGGGGNLFVQPSAGGSYPVWHSGNLNPSADYVNKSNGQTQQMNQQLQIVNSDPMFRVVNQNTGGDFGLRASGNTFQICDGGRTVAYVQVGTDGSLYTSQLGDLNSRIEARASAYASNAASSRVAKAGDIMDGALEVRFSEPFIWLHSPGAVRKRIWLTNDGYLRWRDQNENDDVFRFGPNGDLWTKQFGDLNNRIETRASAYANTRQAQIPTDYGSSAGRTNINGVSATGGSAVVTTDANGNAYVTFAYGFTNSCVSVVACNGDFNNSASGGWIISVSGYGPGGFSAHVQTSTAAIVGQSVRINYYAIGN